MEIKRHYRPEMVKKYEARWYVDRKMKCRRFSTERERETFIAEFTEQIAKNGTDLLLGFEAGKMRRWQEASRLAPEADPVEVMRFWIASNRPTLTPKTIAEGIPAYVKYLRAMERDPSYCKHVESHLIDFNEAMD
jgi:hypothetical protein